MNNPRILWVCGMFGLLLLVISMPSWAMYDIYRVFPAFLGGIMSSMALTQLYLLTRRG